MKRSRRTPWAAKGTSRRLRADVDHAAVRPAIGRALPRGLATLGDAVCARYGKPRDMGGERTVRDDAPGEETEHSDHDARDEDEIQNDHDGRHFEAASFSS